MATDLSKDPATTLTVDASKWDGVELEIYHDGDEDRDNFNIQ